MDNIRDAYISGVGSYLPKRILGNTELENRLGLETGWIEKKTGVKRRHIADEGECVSDMAAAAGRAAIEDAGLTPDDLDMIIVSSSMGDMFFPSTACLVQSKLGAKCPAFDVNNACSGFIYGLAVAESFTARGTCGNILVAAAETMSRMIDWNDYRTSILFGDGAGACIVSSSGRRRLAGFHLGADGSGAEVLKLPGGGSRRPASGNMLKDGENTVYMEGGAVFRFAMKIIADCVREVTAGAGVETSALSMIVPHQSNIAIIREAAKILDVPLEMFHMNLSEVGNTASASVPIALDDAKKKNIVQDNSRIVLVSYGAGLAYAAALVEW